MGFPDGNNGPKGSQGTLVVKLTPPRNASKCHIFSFFDLTPLPHIYFYSIWFGRPPQKKSTRILATSNSDSLQNDTLFFYHVNGPIKKNTFIITLLVKNLLWILMAVLIKAAIKNIICKCFESMSKVLWQLIQNLRPLQQYIAWRQLTERPGNGAYA